MPEFATVLSFALLPAAGNIAGGLLAESMRTPRWVVGASLHAAAGIAIALVSIDLMPRILVTTPMWLIVLAFLAGALFSVMLYRAGGWGRGIRGGGSRAAWMVFMAVAADLFGDGLMTGAGAAVDSGLGLLIAASQSVANIPGGFAATANFRRDGVARWRRLAMSASLLVPVLASATVGYWLLRDTGAFAQNAALAFIVGVLLLATIEDVIPQGDETQPPRWISTAAFAAGFAAMGLLSSSVGWRAFG
jgi:ZIP family zinc transporter